MKILFIFLFFITCSYGQKHSYNTCGGAVWAPVQSVFSLPFLGDKHSNDLWVKYNAPHDGELKLELQSTKEGLSIQLNYFIAGINSCEQNTGTTNGSLELSNPQELVVSLTQNQTLVVHLVAPLKSKDLIHFKSNFTKYNVYESTVDLIYNEDLPKYSLLIRDRASGEPVVSKIFLLGSSDLTGTYFASHLKINLKQKIKSGGIKVEAPGYFPVEYIDRSIPINDSYIDTIYLQKFEVGTLSKLEKLYFNAGLAEITEESYPQLNSLRDLMVLNPNISIEIHGHVNLDENSAKKAQKLSKQRAIMVKKYLVDNGIAPERLYPVGFGSTKPVYAKPQDENQKEANRRVEILIRSN